MKKMVAIFAHPDDEAFGPGGSIVLWSKEYEITLICVTSGDKGGESAIRESELQKSSKRLGVSNVVFLRFEDGYLCNNEYHNIASKIEEILMKIKPDCLLTFDKTGVSGHLDHIAVSYITTFVFKKLAFIKELYYFCVSRKHAAKFHDYFVCFPKGYLREEVDLIIDTSSVWSAKIAAIHMHESQKADSERILSRINNLPKEEYFLVLKK